MNKKQVLILSGIALITFAVIFLLCKRCCDKADSNNIKPILSDSITYWKTEANKSVARVEKLAADYALKDKKFSDSLRKVYKIKYDKQLKEYIVAYTKTKSDVKPVDTIIREVVIVDSTGCEKVLAMRQRFSSNYYKAVVQIGDSSFMRIQITDTISVIWSEIKKRNRLKALVLNISLSNPDTKVEGIKSFRIEQPKPKKFGLGLDIGYEFDGLRLRPYFGLGFSYNFIRF
jgi:hypothetical protein